MKKIYAALLCLPLITNAINYSGNGRTGFGGAIGNSILSVTDNGTTISFSLTRGTGDFNDALVIYIDSKTGGFSSTSGFGDNADGLRRAISGTDGTNRTTVNFGNNLLPDYAIAIEPNPPTGFGGLWSLANGGANSLNYITSVNLTPSTNNATTYTFSVAKTDIGITGTIAFDFVATYISNSAFRSDEAIGFDITGGNPGFNVTVSSTTKYQYPSGILLPVTLSGFNGLLKNNLVRLAWSTATENNLARFEIEQSADARNWSKAGTVQGYNNANGGNYNFSTPLNTMGVMLYRLKIIDKDGGFIYSSQVTIKSVGKTNLELIGNPAKDVVKLAIHQPEAALFTVALLTVNGNRISNTIYRHAGGSTVMDVKVAMLPAGLYVLQISSNYTSKSFKVAVQ